MEHKNHKGKMPMHSKKEMDKHMKEKPKKKKK